MPRLTDLCGNPVGTKFGFEATTLSCQDGRVKSMRMVADIRDLDPNYPNAADWKTIRLNEATTDPKGGHLSDLCS